MRPVDSGYEMHPMGLRPTGIAGPCHSARRSTATSKQDRPQNRFSPEMASGTLQIFMKVHTAKPDLVFPNVCQSWYDIKMGVGKMGVGLWNSIFEIKRPER